MKNKSYRKRRFIVVMFLVSLLILTKITTILALFLGLPHTSDFLTYATVQNTTILGVIGAWIGVEGFKKEESE